MVSIKLAAFVIVTLPLTLKTKGEGERGGGNESAIMPKFLCQKIEVNYLLS